MNGLSMNLIFGGSIRAILCEKSFPCVKYVIALVRILSLGVNMFVKERFELDSNTIETLNSKTPDFGYNGFGEFIFYRTYSRICCQACRCQLGGHNHCPKCGCVATHGQETWADVVRRVTEGTLSIRKDWYVRNQINWREDFWRHYARHFAISMFDMKWLPPGRGLWAMGSNFVYERGSMALQNCGFIRLGENLGTDISWLMDAMMMGVGVGFWPVRDDKLRLYAPTTDKIKQYKIPDTREGWCEATKLLIDSYQQPRCSRVELDYSGIRGYGLPIRGFGGISSGSEPLIRFHEQIRNFMCRFITAYYEITLDRYGSVMLKADIANAAGCCIVAGNVRRSAELLMGELDDIVDFKNYTKYPHREAFGWMSNNSVLLSEDADFERMGEIAERIKNNGEPGIINMKNVPLARIGKSMEGLRRDEAIGVNPCGEQLLENHETCTLAETCPTRCADQMDWLKAVEYATFYASTVTLLPTHSPQTNAAMQKNRRIGVGIIDVVGWENQIGTTQLIKRLRQGYNHVRSINKWANNEAGIPEAIRVTTIKPGGTVPKMPGLRSGFQWPTFGLTLRRVRVAQGSQVYEILHEAGVPHEPDVFSANTEVFEWPIDQSNNGQIKSAEHVSIWQQATMLILLQREWSDNAVSNTLYFKPAWPLFKDFNLGQTLNECHWSKELQDEIYKVLPDETLWDDFLQVQEYDGDIYDGQLYLGRLRLEQDRWSQDWHLKVYRYDPNHEEDQIENVLAAIAPLTKTVSLLPHTPKGVYAQMPEEGVRQEEYDRRLKAIKKIDWSRLTKSDGLDEKFCQGPTCEVIR